MSTITSDEAEKAFCKHYIKTSNASEAYKVAFPKEAEKLSNTITSKRGLALLNRNHIKEYIALQEMSTKDLAVEVLREELLSGGDKSKRVQAASIVLEKLVKDNVKKSADRWIEALCSVGATVIKPTSKGVVEESLEDVVKKKSSVISLRDIAKSLAYVMLDGDARIKLSHMAGAPFADDPEAELHEVQKEVLSRTEREVIWHAGSRGGKSVTGGVQAFINLCIPGQRIAIIADTYEHCHNEFDYAYRAFDNLFGAYATTRYHNTNVGNQHNMRIDTVWNCTLQTFSVGNDNLDSTSY